MEIYGNSANGEGWVVASGCICCYVCTADCQLLHSLSSTGDCPVFSASVDAALRVYWRKKYSGMEFDCFLVTDNSIGSHS